MTTLNKINTDDIPNLSDEAKQAINNINTAFAELQTVIDGMQRRADFAQGKPPKGMAYEHLGIVHGSEYVITKDKHQAQHDLLDKNYEGNNLNQSISDTCDLIVTINVPTSENKDG